MIECKTKLIHQSPLSESELIDGLQAGLMVLDRERRFLFVNRWLAGRLGRAEANLLGSSLDAWLSMDTWVQTEPLLAALFDRGETVLWRGTLITIAGHKLWMQFAAVPQRRGDEVIAQITCWDISPFQDLTAECQSLERSLESQSREMTALYCIGEAGALTLCLDDIAQLVYAQIEQLFRFSAFALVLYEAEQQTVLPILVREHGQTVSLPAWSLDQERGLIGWSLQAREPLLIRDYARMTELERARWPVKHDRIWQSDTRSWLSMPLVMQERVLGVLCLQHDQADTFGEAEQRSLRSLADYSSIVIENVWLHQQTEMQLHELEQANREMQALQGLSSVLQSSLESKHVFQLVVNGLVTGLGYNLAILAVIDDKERKLVFAALDVTGQPGGMPLLDVLRQDARISMDEYDNLGVRAVQEARTMITHTLYDLLCPWGDPVTALKAQESLAVQTLVAVPLMARDKMSGCLFAGIGRPEVTGREIALLNAFANQSAIAIENAQLYSTLNQRLTEVSTLYTLANQISYSLDLDIVLDSVVNTLRKVLNCRSSCIFLLDEDQEWMEIRASSGIKPRWQREARLRLGEGISGKVAQEARTRYIPDTRLDPDFITFDPTVRSLLVVPLMVKGRVIGTLSVDDDKPDAFSTNEGLLLTITAATAAVAIDNARLYENLKERADKLAQAYAELQEASRLKSEFVQNVSHELRTPLTFIRGYVDLLLDGMLGEINEQQREKFQIVSNRTNSIIHLIDDILSLQQLERQNLHMDVYSIQDVAHMAVKSAEVAAQQNGLVLIEEYEPNLSPIWGDRMRLDQVFNNLIGNAIKFSPDGGTVRVRARSGQGYVYVDVIDQGIGIPKDKQSRIFERFYQVDGSSKRRFGGTGLGLAIVKEIIDAHGGMVKVESELGHGSTFTFSVPVAMITDRNIPMEE